MRDWALIGGLTCALAPAAVGMLTMPSLFQSGFVAWAGLLGTVSGALVGALARWCLGRLSERNWVAVAVLLGVPLLGAWGALVSGTVAWFCHPIFFHFAVPCGSLSALLVTSWLAPCYVALARGDCVRLPLAVLGPVVGGPVCGVACLTSVALLLDLVRWL